MSWWFGRQVTHGNGDLLLFASCSSESCPGLQGSTLQATARAGSLRLIPAKIGSKLAVN